MYVITLLGEMYYSIRQEELINYQAKIITLSGSKFIALSGDDIALSGNYYIIRRFLLYYQAVITLTGDYYITGCNRRLDGTRRHPVGKSVSETRQYKYHYL